MDSEGIVRSIHGSHAWVELRGDCDSCGESGGCGWKKGHQLQRFANSVGARAGDRVIVTLPDGLVWRATLSCYVVPLLAALFGAGTGAWAFGETGAALGAGLGLAVGWLRLRFFPGRVLAPEMRLKTSTVFVQRN